MSGIQTRVFDEFSHLTLTTLELYYPILQMRGELGKCSKATCLSAGSPDSQSGLSEMPRLGNPTCAFILLKKALSSDGLLTVLITGAFPNSSLFCIPLTY